MLINGVEFKFGADPEVFVKTDKFVSAHGMVPGDKKNPHKVKDGAVQVDGMALEFNIDPVDNLVDWEHNLTSVMGQLENMIPKDHKIEIVSTAEFGKEYIDAQPEEAKELGCDPDMNAYTGDYNPTPDGDVPFRTGAGHIHVGWGENIDVNDPDHIEACITLTKWMDYRLGIPSLLWDKDNERRKLYGKAGAFRPKPYGVEYRVLSNKWLKHKQLRNFVWEGVVSSIRGAFYSNQPYSGKEIERKINTGQSNIDFYAWNRHYDHLERFA